jgi:nucleoside-diphosphate-sugar epimerase
MDALIGSTGFVGGHLTAQHGFAGFNSRTVAQARGQAFDTLVCAAAPGSMFEANKFPDQDRARVEAVMQALDGVTARQMVLVSTIAVLDGFAADGEDAAIWQETTPYGVNRRALEVFCAGRFERCLVVRLPALFGDGLKKNFIFDILNPMPSMLGDAPLQALGEALPPALSALLPTLYVRDETLGMHVIDRAALDASGQRAAFDEAVTALGKSAINFTNPATRFQYYDMRRLWSDIGTGLGAGLDALHLGPEPLEAARVFETLTGRAMPDTGARLHAEDMRTGHSGLFGRDDGFIDGADAVLSAIADFGRRARAAA